MPREVELVGAQEVVDVGHLLLQALRGTGRRWRAPRWCRPASRVAWASVARYAANSSTSDCRKSESRPVERIQIAIEEGAGQLAVERVVRELRVLEEGRREPRDVGLGGSCIGRTSRGLACSSHPPNENESEFERYEEGRRLGRHFHETPKLSEAVGSQTGPSPPSTLGLIDCTDLTPSLQN